MRFKGTLILFVIAAALLGYFYFVERPRRAASRQEAALDRSLVNFDREVTHVWIDRPTERLEFVMTGSRWDMRSPLEDHADAGAVGTLVAAVADAFVERNLGPEEALAQYGLDNPAAAVTFAGETGDTLLQLQIGGYTVDKSFVYARRAGESDVLLIPTGIRRYALPAVEDFRYKRVITYDLSVVTSFTTHDHGTETTWRRAGSRAWFTVQNRDTVRGDPTAVESILKRLRAMRVRSFADPATASGWFSDSGRWVRVEKLDGGPAQTVYFADTDGGVFTKLSGEDRVVEVDTTATQVFAYSVFDLRDRRLLHFDRTLVGKITVATPDTSATLVRTGEVWTHPNPALGQMDSGRVGAFVGALQQLAFTDVLSESPPAPTATLERAILTLVVYGVDATIIDELECWRGADRETTLATSRSSGVVAKVANNDLGSLVALLQRIRP